MGSGELDGGGGLSGSGELLVDTGGGLRDQEGAQVGGGLSVGRGHLDQVLAALHLGAEGSGVDADFAFVPHSGPFARGIHVICDKPLALSLKEAKALEGRLNNPAFVEKAKPEAVEKARADHAEKSAEAERLAAALSRLG